MVQRHLGHACSHFACCLFCSSPCILSDENIASLTCVVTVGQNGYAAGSPSGSHVVATSRRLKLMSWSKKSMPSNALISNQSITAGTHVPDTTSLTTPATGARAIAGHIGLHSMQTPTVHMYPRMTAGALRVSYHQSLQVCLPRASHHGSHIQIRVLR